MCGVLRHDIGARFQRVKRVPHLGNSTRCLLLRQHYAKMMLEKLDAGWRVINLDQTWVNDANFMRRKWRLRGQSNSISERRIAPRISVQLAICTEGSLYFSLSQANTDSKTFCLFITWLANRLSRKDRNWRDNTLLLIDGARYQTSRESMGYMRRLGFRVAVSAPYSYAAAPVELAFAHLKAGNLNPTSLPTGKR